MSGNSHLEVQWIPGLEDHLLTWSSDVKLYQIRRYDPMPRFCDETSIKISPTCVAELQTSLPDPPHYMKCVKVYPIAGRSGDIRVAVGQASGRVSLYNFMSPSKPFKEFGPKHGRQCNSIDWNPFNTDLLAAGYEKSRNDYAILLYDTSRDLTPETRVSTKEKDADVMRAAVEICVSEVCQSLTWVKNHGQTLVAGMNNKNLKVFDIRDPSKPQLTNITRAVHGVCVDPALDYRIASHHDQTVTIWDTRNFDKPIVTVTKPQKVLKLNWSPSRAGLLCSAMDGKSTLTLHDIQSWAVMGDEGDPAVTERSIRGWVDANDEVPDSPITSFDWHPSEENTLLAVRGNKLCECIIMERISPSWSAQHSLVWHQGGELRFIEKDNDLYSAVGDISIVMQRRAVAGYGEEENVANNGNYVESKILKDVWSWLDQCGKLMKDLSFRNQFSRSVSFPGVRTALFIDRPGGGAVRSDIIYLPWNGVDSSYLKPRRVFRSDQRERALKLCGWGTEGEVVRFLDRLVDLGQYSRAAAVAVFNLELRQALKVLQSTVKREEVGDEVANTLSTVAIALSGFSEDKAGLWRDMVLTHASQLKDPYLRATFAFLTAENDNYSAIINETAIHLADRIALCCLYLPDNRLVELLNRYWRDLKDNGDLSAVLLSGMGPESVELLQRYLDMTGDVQTACWIAVRSLPVDLASEGAAQGWITSYRDLLDAWSLYKSRADLDIAVNRAGITKHTPKQVYVSCNFCGTGVGQNLKGMPRDDELRTASMTRPAASREDVRIQSCNACRKPLPRCAICLINMGTLAGQLLSEEAPSADAKKPTPFEKFFTWCQTCRHGGHASHIQRWFVDHTECPVSGCNCKCSSIDSTILSLGSNVHSMSVGAAS